MKPYALRTALESDIPFIYSTWLKSYKHDSDIGLSTTKTIFFNNYRLVLDKILGAPKTRVLIACATDDHLVIYGYLVSECLGNILHYIFVKEAFWNFGIAKALIATSFPDQKTITYTHRTESVKPLLRDRPGFTYNPFLLFNKGESNE